MISRTPGVAGGTVQDSFTATAKVTALDAAKREITLASDDGAKATFVTGPEVQNFDQIKVGDVVSATIHERLDVFVRSGSEDPTITQAAMLAAAPKGAKPGATIAQSYEITAKVTALDATKRTADLTFSDGTVKTISVREDVDMSKYNVGDTVVIQVTEALSILVKSP
jgi:translation elongation factor P/translation initiation factor 5A